MMSVARCIVTHEQQESVLTVAAGLSNWTEEVKMKNKKTLLGQETSQTAEIPITGK